MAKLILTEEEKAAATWMELDDATIGKLVKKTALGLMSLKDEQAHVWWWSAAILLCSMASDANADKFEQEILGLTHSGEERGNWRITVERING